MTNDRQQPENLDKTAYYTKQYNARAMIPEHSRIFTRWQKESAHVRRSQAALLDIAFGDSSGERLDFFPARSAGGPLLVFIHGGWWRSLDKSDFSFVAAPYTRAGYNVALTNYTLAPGATINEIVMQQLRALAWLYRNADGYDVDAQRIVLAGHSAGAHLAAMLIAAQWTRFAADLPNDLVKAAVLMSGLYDLSPIVHADFVNVDLKLTADSVGDVSPAWMPQSHPVPFLTAAGGLESEEFKRQTSLIGERWQATHRGEVSVPDANHLTICDAFATPGAPMFDDTVGMMKEVLKLD